VTPTVKFPATFSVDLCSALFIPGTEDFLDMSGTWTWFRFSSDNIYSTPILNFSEDESLNYQMGFFPTIDLRVGKKQVQRRELTIFKMPNCCLKLGSSDKFLALFNLGQISLSQWSLQGTFLASHQLTLL
jgi:hypothetical protein